MPIRAIKGFLIFFFPSVQSFSHSKLYARSIYNAAIQRGSSHAEAAALVEAIMQAEEELYSEEE